MDKNIGRLATLGYYAFQQTRLGFLNQIRDIVRKINEGISFDEVEDKKESKTFSTKYGDSKLLLLIYTLHLEGKIDKQTYIFLTDCLETVLGKTLDVKTGKSKAIPLVLKCEHCKTESILDDTFKGVAGIEQQYKKLMEKAIKKEPIYIDFLSKIRGMGPTHSANLLKAFGDCSSYDTLSRLWAHCGYSVVNGRAPRRAKGETINYSPDLRTMVWKISDNLMKQNKGIYRKTYDLTKTKQLMREYPEGELAEKFNGYKAEDTHLLKGHAHNRALRKMVKLFLSHFWEASRTLAGLPCERTYVEGVLEHEHIIHWEEALELEGCLVE